MLILYYVIFCIEYILTLNLDKSVNFTKFATLKFDINKYFTAYDIHNMFFNRLF